MQKRYISFVQDCGFKEQKHPFTRFQGCFFSNIDFNFLHFANFEIEESFGLI